MRASKSLSLSGAGFLGSYHLGVVSALQANNFLPDYSGKHATTVSGGDVMLLGASAGALVAASVFAGSRTEDLMNILLTLAKEASSRPINALTPGFSLIDVLEPHLRTELGSVAPSLLSKRLAGGRLRVALTAPGPGFLTNPCKASRTVDTFRDAEHLVAACILSSYVPAATGPLCPAEDSAAGRAAKTMAAAWGIKGGDVELQLVPQQAGAGAFIDGGLATMWPVRDHTTVIASPIAVRSDHGNGTICPSGDFRWFVRGGRGVTVDASLSNLTRGWSMLISPTAAELEKSFRDGHDDAQHFLGRSTG